MRTCTYCHRVSRSPSISCATPCLGLAELSDQDVPSTLPTSDLLLKSTQRVSPSYAAGARTMHIETVATLLLHSNTVGTSAEPNTPRYVSAIMWRCCPRAVPSSTSLVLSYDERGRRMECAHPIQVGGLCAICGKDLEA